MNVVAPLAGVPNFPAVFVDNRNMEPAIRLNAVVFLGALRQHNWDGLYCFTEAFEPGRPPGPVYRVQFRGRHVAMWHDNAGPTKTVHEVPPQDFKRLEWWPVVGVVNPLSIEFERLLQDRFREGGW